jgi:hypothetical protein
MSEYATRAAAAIRLSFSQSSEIADAAESDLAEIIDQRDRARESLRNLFALVESGVLVRDTSHDADPKWYLKAIELARVLTAAHDEIKEAA